MAEALKILGQSKPAAGVLTAAYTVPAATTTVVSTITVCEQAGVATSFRLSAAVAGAADTPSQYLVYNAPLKANETLALTLGITLGIADVVRVSSLGGSVSFNLFGVEKT